MNTYTESGRDHAVKVAQDNVDTFREQLARYEALRSTTDDPKGLENYIQATKRDLAWAEKQLKEALSLPIQPNLF